MLKGKVIKYGDNIDTDVIIPARYLSTSDAFELAKHCMEDIDKDFNKKIVKGDIIIGGKNFGCGSSREHAPLAIKTSGISVVIAETFARIFFRNSINIGLPIIECKEAAQDALNGHEMEIDIASGIINNLTIGKTYKIPPFPKFMQDIIDSDGLINQLRAGVKH